MFKEILQKLILKPPVPPSEMKEIDEKEGEELANKKQQYKTELTAWYEVNRSGFLENIRDSRKDLDSAILTLSSAGLGLGITVIQLIRVPVQDLYLMLGSWIFFSMAIVLTLISYVIAEANSEKKLDELTALYIETAQKEKLELEAVNENKSWQWTKNCRDFITNSIDSNVLGITNIFSLVAFFVGLVLLSLFCWNNISFRQLNYLKTREVNVRAADESGKEKMMDENNQSKEEKEKQNIEFDKGNKPADITPLPKPDKPKPDQQEKNK